MGDRYLTRKGNYEAIKKFVTALKEYLAYIY